MNITMRAFCVYEGGFIWVLGKNYGKLLGHVTGDVNEEILKFWSKFIRKEELENNILGKSII